MNPVIKKLKTARDALINLGDPEDAALIDDVIEQMVVAKKPNPIEFRPCDRDYLISLIARSGYSTKQCGYLSGIGERKLRYYLNGRKYSYAEQYLLESFVATSDKRIG